VKQRVANWNGIPSVEAEVYDLRDEADLRQTIAATPRLIARGMGRSYGDASLSETIVNALPRNRLLEFDSARGVVRCEAGATIEDLVEAFLPRGWFPAVTPGTRHVSLGGAIASDVHGKGPGRFSDHIQDFRLMTADGAVRNVSRESDPALFETTCGGMGLTGIVLETTLRLHPVESAYLREEIVPCRDLEAVMARFSEPSAHRYSVAWIDCAARGRNLGRSLLLRGDHARAADLPPAARDAPLRRPFRRPVGVPFPFPNCALNPWTVRAFNALTYRSHGAQERITDFETFFYPLDFVRDWNRIYGRRGFLQYQFVLPPESCERGLPAMLERIAGFGTGSFLAVLKRFSPSESFISFPREGFFLALDFPWSPSLPARLDELDRMLLELGGRLYLAKDARMKPELFFRGYPNAHEFCRRLRVLDPSAKFQSLQSRRLGLHVPPPEGATS
jgi:decaprenylphospho-beta-D-ribofuranose 2-oxidase